MGNRIRTAVVDCWIPDRIVVKLPNSRFVTHRCHYSLSKYCRIASTTKYG